jgi:hypothetical protein
MMKNFLKQKRELFAVAAFVAVIACVVLFGIIPLQDKIVDVGEKIQQENADQEINKQRIDELPKIKQQYDTLKQNEDSLNVLLDPKSAVFLIERLEKLANDTVNIIKIAVQEKQPDQKALPAAKGKADENPLIKALPSADYLQINIGLSGDYGSVVRFINSLENFEYYADIISLNLKKSDAKNSTIQTATGSGLLNPFNPDSAGAKKTDQPASNLEEIDASLNVVFYTKK